MKLKPTKLSCVLIGIILGILLIPFFTFINESIKEQSITEEKAVNTCISKGINENYCIKNLLGN